MRGKILRADRSDRYLAGIIHDTGKSGRTILMAGQVRRSERAKAKSFIVLFILAAWNGIRPLEECVESPSCHLSKLTSMAI